MYSTGEDWGAKGVDSGFNHSISPTNSYATRSGLWLAIDPGGGGGVEAEVLSAGAYDGEERAYDGEELKN